MSAEYFPTILVDMDLIIVIFHKLLQIFNFKILKSFVKVVWLNSSTILIFQKEIPDLY